MRRSMLLASCVIVAATLARPATAAQATDRVEDYSHAIPLTVSGTQAVVQLRLPRDVYLHSRAADLRDVRVFDSGGVKVPFTVARAPQQGHASRATMPVGIFPVFDAGGGRNRLPEGLEIRTSNEGSLLSVVTRSTKAGDDGSSKPLSSLILEVRPPARDAAVAPAPAVDALSLALPAGTNNYSARIELEVSDDLKNWDRVAETALNWLVNGATETLASNRIEFAPTTFRYARLTWIEGQPIEFARIVAEFPRQDKVSEHTESLLVAPQPGRVGQDLLYPSALGIPVERIGAQFSEPNVVLPVLLGQYVELPSRELRKETTFEFRPALRTTFFQLVQGGKARVSGDVTVMPRHAGHWVLRPDAGGRGRPSLRLTWSPATLYFVASGTPPYTLAFGRDPVQPAQVGLAQVAPGFSAAELLSTEHARVGPTRRQQAGPQQPAGGSAGLTSARSRVAMLWSVLLLGVAGLAWMAWQLTAQMRRRPEDTPPV